MPTYTSGEMECHQLKGQIATARWPAGTVLIESDSFESEKEDPNR